MMPLPPSSNPPMGGAPIGLGGPPPMAAPPGPMGPDPSLMLALAAAAKGKKKGASKRRGNVANLKKGRKGRAAKKR